MIQWREHLEAQKQKQMGPAPHTAAIMPDTGAYSKIHLSHARVSIRHLIFCKRCGYWMANKTQKLTEKCLRPPRNNGVKGSLERMLRGLHPDSKVLQWPDGSNANVASPLSNLDPL